ncbi:MAG: helix-turn-helix domain-containing protein, partial [Pygmaiobacter sp.]
MSVTADRVLAEMKRQKLSYANLATLTGVPKSALQRYATGTTPKLPADRLCAIASALRCSTSWLLGEEEAPKDDTAQRVALAPT